MGIIILESGPRSLKFISLTAWLLLKELSCLADPMGASVEVQLRFNVCVHSEAGLETAT